MTSEEIFSMRDKLTTILMAVDALKDKVYLETPQWVAIIEGNCKQMLTLLDEIERKKNNAQRDNHYGSIY